ncbi:MAG: hypothetical protein IIY96_00990 [Lachnospiraceae bacterium]|nr:hypothetical protein [Lachnospiraceae bacterium]
MTKRDYLAKLSEYLSYELPERLVVKNLEYYSEYIDSEVSGGKNVSSVLEDLGDPQLIARSIIDAAKSGADGIPYTEDDRDFRSEVYGSGNAPGQSSGWFGGGSSQGYDGGYQGSGNFGGDQTGSRGDAGGGFHVYNLGCFSVILFALILMCVISLLGSILGALSPILAPICMVMLVMWLLGRRGR